MKVTSVQLAFTGLETAESGQSTIEGFFTTTPDRGKLESSSSAARSALKRRRDAGEDINDDALPRMDLLESEASTTISDSSTSFDCSRCGKRVVLAEQYVGADVEGIYRAQALSTLRMEHDDFHFAQDLAETPNAVQTGRQGETQKKRKKKRDEPEGIAKFFSKR